jgi:hypothetical protein
MSMIDPWEKAADCERSLQATADPQRRYVLRHLRDLWIGVGNESGFTTPDKLAQEIEVIGRLHADFAATPAVH